MNDSALVAFYDPALIVVPREMRQRRELNDNTALRLSIEARGVINPIIVRTAPDTGAMILVAGEQRLRACAELGVRVPVRMFADLDETEAQIIELEENVKRTDLPWRDHVRAVAKIHALYAAQNPTWTQGQTAKALGVPDTWIYRVMRVAHALDSPRLATVASIDHAYNVLLRLAERKTEEYVNEITAMGSEAFAAQPSDTSNEPAPSNHDNLAHSVAGVGVAGSVPSSSVHSHSAARPQPVVCADFLTWAPAYAGPKFNLVHCDFPYGVFMGGNFGANDGAVQGAGEALYENTPELYFALLDALTTNLNTIASYSSHLVFWLSMKFYTDTVQRLRRAGLFVHDHPFVWHKSDGRGITPGLNIYPQRTYDTALLTSRGNRPLVKMSGNSFSGPGPSKPMHPSEKSTPMFKFLFQMLVDETTSVFDPTCGSGAALRAAEELGAKHILGLELDSTHAKNANDATLRARAMREALR